MALKTFIYGTVFGLSLIVPGVSGGTIAIILGFYDQLIEAVNGLTKDFWRQLKFLVPFGAGILIGIVLFASVIQFLLNYYSFIAMMFFIGLIAGVIPNIYRQVRKYSEKNNTQKRAKDLLLMIIPIALLVSITHLNTNTAALYPAEIDLSLMLFIFVIGIIAAASILIPGLSGSFILLLAGIYPLATHAVSSIRLLPGDITNLDLIFNIARVLGPLGLGVIIGILFTARLIKRLLKQRSKSVFLVILGLMTGSVYALLLDPILLYSGINVPVFIIGLASCGVAVILSYKIGRKGILQDS